MNCNLLFKRIVNRLCLVVFICLIGLVAKSQRIGNKVMARRFEIMLSSHSADTLLNLLSSKFSVGVYTGNAAIQCLNNIADGIKMNQVKVSDGGKKNKCSITLKGKDQRDLTGNIFLDDSGKILYVDVFDKLYGLNRYAHSKLVAEVPFETDMNGSIILEVKLNDNDRVLKLLFDTGADGMALSSSLADSLGISRDFKRSTSVVGGKQEIEISKNNTVHLGELEFPRQSIGIFEKMDSYDGIMGNTLVKSYITEVNYDKKSISFYSFGDFDLDSRKGDKGEFVDITLPSSLVIIPGHVEVTKDKVYNGDFVFDLGAAYSLICFRPFVRKNRLLVDGFKPAYSGSTMSLGMVTPTFTGSAESFHFGGLPKINGLTVTLMSGGGQSESWNPDFDGSIGSRLISKYNFIIDLQSKRILFTPNKSINYPADFSRSGMLFGFTPDGELVFQNYASGRTPPNMVIEGVKLMSSVESKPEEEVLRAGQKIFEINGISAHDLRTDRNKLRQLLSLPANQKWTLSIERSGKAVLIEI